MTASEESSDDESMDVSFDDAIRCNPREWNPEGVASPPSSVQGDGDEQGQGGPSVGDFAGRSTA